MHLWMQEPKFFPPLKFFYGLVNSDVWVILDHAPFNVRSTHCFCRIRSRTGIQVLTVPVKHPCSKPIYAMMINNIPTWKEHFFDAIERAYGTAPFYDEYINGLKYYIEAPNVLIETLNVHTTSWIAKLLGTNPRLMYTQRINTPPKDLVEKLCKTLNAKIFKKRFKHPTYQQLQQPFEKGLSVLDALFCLGGQQTRKLLDG